jgi:hypothetical protein
MGCVARLALELAMKAAMGAGAASRQLKEN